MVFNVAKLGRCHNVGIFVVFNVAKLGWCHKDSILMPVLTSQGVNCMSIYVGLVLSYPPTPLVLTPNKQCQLQVQGSDLSIRISIFFSEQIFATW
jgi:hypothetical protein